MNLRKLSVADVELLCQLRVDFLLEEQSEITENELIGLKAACREFFFSAFNSNSFIAIVAEDEGNVLSTAFLNMQMKPPRKSHSPLYSGTIYNVFTYKNFRRRGLATTVLTALINEARTANLSSVDLLASDVGEKLYHLLGFQQVNYSPMRLELSNTQGKIWN